MRGPEPTASSGATVRGPGRPARSGCPGAWTLRRERAARRGPLPGGPQGPLPRRPKPAARAHPGRADPRRPVAGGTGARRDAGRGPHGRRRRQLVPAPAVLSSGMSPTHALVMSQIALSFGIPSALVPLVALTRDRAVTGPLGEPARDHGRRGGGERGDRGAERESAGESGPKAGAGARRASASCRALAFGTPPPRPRPLSCSPLGLPAHVPCHETRPPTGRRLHAPAVVVGVGVGAQRGRPRSTDGAAGTGVRSIDNLFIRGNSA